MPYPPLSPRLRLLPWLILALGLALTYMLQDSARETSRQARQSEFEARADDIAATIRRRMQNYEQVLAGAVGLFAASPTVRHKEFAEYVRALALEGKFPGIQGVGVAAWIPAMDKAAHIARLRAEGSSGYDIRPAGDREAYSSIMYLEPPSWRNQRAIGFDMYSEPTRRAAMEKARDEASTIISAKVRLVQETEQDVQAGFLMYLPVYRQQSARQTAADRRASLSAWVYAPFRMNDLMNGILGPRMDEFSHAMDIEIYDGTAMESRSLLFDSNGGARRPPSGFQTRRTIDLFGRQWTVALYSLPAFDARGGTDKAGLIAVAGILGSALLALVVWLLVNARDRAQTMAEQMTAELRQQTREQMRLNRALRLLGECNMALVHADNEYKLLAEVCRLIVEHGDYLMAWVGYAEQDEARTVRPVAQSGYESGYLDGVNITWSDTERGQGPTGTAIRTGTASVNQNVLTNPKMAPWREAAIRRGYQSSVALPLIANAQVLGALTLYASDADAFNADEVQLLEKMANELAYGIDTLRTRAAHTAAEEKVAFLAHFDPLTQLPNRLLLRDRFAQAALVARQDKSLIAMLYLDLDNFKQINDSLGHEAGDRMLVTVVARLRQCLPDMDTISRLSGDEFVVLHTGIRDAVAAASAANAILDAFTEPVEVNGQSLNVTFSIGIGLFPGDGEDFDNLLKCADTAVNHAKESGRNTYRFYTPQMNHDAIEQMRLKGRLHQAIRKREFLLHYQPQIALDSGRVIGAEALVRWQDPEDGLISPARFIPLAEQSGHIVPLGEWVLGEACRQARTWMDQGLPPLVVAVNLSAVQFKRGNITDMVSTVLAATGLPPDRLELELTESILLQDVEATMQTLRNLKAMGIKLSIDDFGTGYSSLSYLKQLAVDKLKIDQSFVRDLQTDPDDASIVQAVVQLGHALELTVIAEGVETQAQLAFLSSTGCDEAQGYLYSRPVPAAQFVELIGRSVRQLEH